jgi:hypothetical protein
MENGKRRMCNHKHKNHHRDPNNNHVEDNDLEIVTGKKVEEEHHGDWTKGNKVRPEDNLATDVDNPTAQIPTKPTVSMSCPSYTSEITCWMMELAKQIGPSGVHALPLGVAAERSVHYFRDYFSFLSFFSATYFSLRRGCPRVKKFGWSFKSQKK